MLHIYMDLVKIGVLASLHGDDRGLDPVGGEIFKLCAYRDSIDHNISECIVFLYDLESLVNMRKIRVVLIPRY